MLTVGANTAARLLAAGDGGLDVCHVAWVEFPSPVGRKYYANRTVTIGGIAYEPKLLGAPSVPKRSAESTH